MLAYATFLLLKEERVRRVRSGFSAREYITDLVFISGSFFWVQNLAIAPQLCLYIFLEFFTAISIQAQGRSYDSRFDRAGQSQPQGLL